MPDVNDMELVREFVRTHSETAFTELVRRHIGLVYSVARRLTGSDGDAQDVTQTVFIILARKAAGMREGTVLTGWLYETTRHAAAHCQRTKARRHAREQEAYMQSITTEAETADAWQQLAPHLEDAMARLAEHDRTLLALRFFENKTAAETAAAMNLTEDAVKKRAARAIEKLRKFFGKRGMVLSAGVIAGAVSANSIQAVPAGLAGIISAAALSETTLTTAAVLALTKTMAMTTLQKTIITAALALTVGAGIYEAREAAKARAEAQTWQQQQAPLVEQIQQLQKERDDATNRLAAMARDIAKIKSNNNELLKLRGQTAILRQDSAELAQKKNQQSQFMGFALEQEKEEMTNAVADRINKLQGRLKLSADQAQQMENRLLTNIEARAQLEMKALSGNQPEAQNQLKQMLDEEESAIMALLDPDQQATYQQMKQEQAADRTAAFAKQEAANMDSYLQLSDEQSQGVVSILAGLPPGQGGIGSATDANAEAQLEMRIQALSQILTPDQLEKYRENKLAGIQQSKAMLQMLRMATK